MTAKESDSGIVFNDMHIDFITSSSGIFAGNNRQYYWRSSKDAYLGFGWVLGKDNLLEAPCNVVTDADSSDCMLESLREFMEKKLGG